MKKGRIIIVLGILAILIISAYLFIQNVPSRESKLFGVTFSKPFAEKFGLDWKMVYAEIFSDLKIRNIRIPVYWSEVEPEEDKWFFDDIDWQLEKAKEYDAKVILAIGRKLPRWPECHEPQWVQPYEVQLRKVELLSYIEKTVIRYRDNSAVWAWQIENEPFLPFGECPPLDKKFLDEEIALVRRISNKPIIITDSGEFGTWIPAAKRADIFGSTLYRYIYTNFFGYLTYPLPPSFFHLKQGLVKLLIGDKPMIVVELQAEPWLQKMLYETSIEEHLKHFNPERFKKELEYIKGTGFDTFYFWGVEWWYWLKIKGNSEIWDMAKEAIKAVGATP